MVERSNQNQNEFKRSSDMEREQRRERRRQSALERLGVKNPACIYCGETDPLILERHHIAGRAYDRSTVVLCRNHHRKLSDQQKDQPPKITEIPDGVESIAHFLEGLADLFELLVGKLREFAKLLFERADPNRDNDEPGP